MKQLFTAILCICAAAWAIAEEKPDGFSHALNLGGTLTDGNSDTLQINAAITTEGHKEGLGSIRAGIEGNYGESKKNGEEKEKTIENIRVFANTKKTLSPKTFASIDASLLHDDIANIDYRVILSPGLGFYIIKNDKTSFYLEAGPAYVWEKVESKEDDYLALRVAERFDYALTDSSQIWQALEYVPKADDFGQYLLNAELGVSAAMNSHVNLRVALQNKYNSEPGADTEKNDLILTTGISIAL